MSAPPCLDLEACEAYISGALDLDEAAAATNHVDSCAACRQLVEDVRADATLLDDVREAWDDAIGVPSSANREPIAVEGYDVVGLLHEGGQGAVYEAVQRSTQRRVAIKVLLRGRRATPRERHRFEREVELAARLDHPNIVTILDSGRADDGRPYLVMALVDGEPLDRYARTRDLGAEQVLRLFLKVADAVSFAHRHGVLHRDLKPSNIVIDASGEPQLVDFGLAKALDELEPERASLRTRSGEFVGTIAYAAPEQVLGDPNAVDTRADLYALGVILYELLAQRLPYDVDPSSIAHAARTVAEVDPTPLSQSSRAFRGDVSTIADRALRKQPSERYQSVADLADDIRRHLGHEPIVARPASAPYRLRKFARRHPAVAAIIVLLAAGAIVATWQASRLHSEVETRETVAAFLRDVLTSIDPDRARGDVPTVREIVDDAAVRLVEAFPDAPEVRLELHETLGRTYYQLGAFEAALEQYRLAHDGRVEQDGPDADGALDVLASIGLTLRELDRLDEAESLLRDGIALSREQNVTFDRLRNNLAIVLDRLGRDSEAAEMFGELYESARARSGADDRQALLAQNNLGKILVDLQRFDEARQLIEDCLARRRSTLGDDHPDTLVTLSTLASLEANTGHPDAALPLYAELVDTSTRVRGRQHPSTLAARLNQVRVLWTSGNADDAVAQGASLFADSEAELGRNHADAIAVLEVHTAMIAGRGRATEAIELATAWHDGLCTDLGAEHRNTQRVAGLLEYLRSAADGAG